MNTAKKLVQNNQIITSSVEIVESIKTNSSYILSTTSANDTNLVSVQKGVFTLFIIEEDLWSNENSWGPIQSKLIHQNHKIVCLSSGNVEFPEILKNNLHISQLAMPSNLHSINIFIEDQFKNLQQQDNLHNQIKNTNKHADDVQVLLSVAASINGERNIDNLLKVILENARRITNAEAGSIYQLNEEKDKIHFHTAQNSKMKINFKKFSLEIDDKTTVGRSFLSKEAQITKKNQNFKSNLANEIEYQTHSMLTLPILNLDDEVIGIIQLINKKDKDQYTDFDQDDIEKAKIVAIQSGIAIENALLTSSIQNLFKSFVHAAVSTIEKRDPTTSGHSTRVANITVGLAQAVDQASCSEFDKVSFNEDQIKEIEYASLLHDFGKVAVKEDILLKNEKLYPWQLNNINYRYLLGQTSFENQKIKELLNKMDSSNIKDKESMLGELDSEINKFRDDFQSFKSIIDTANKPTVLEENVSDKLQQISKIEFDDCLGDCHRLLTDQELTSLAIKRGSLTKDEFNEIKMHVTHTYEFLNQIPWGKSLSRVPEIALMHHEKLDGSGYPHSLKAEKIPIESRMMTIVDIFDALTAKDRPYKKAIPVKRALEIIEMEVNSGKLDRELFNLFTESKIYQIID